MTEANGEVFVSQGSYFGTSGLFALNAANGNTIWSTQFSGVFSVNPPAYAAGNVYIQTGKGTSNPPPYLSAFNAQTGVLTFRNTFGAQWENYYAPTPYAGNVYVDGGYYGGAYGFNGSNGNQLWFNSNLPQYDQWTPAVDDKYVYTYLGEYSPALYVLNRNTGTTAFSIADSGFDWNGWSMDEAVVLGGDQDAIAIQSGRLLKFDLASHAIAWQIARGFVGQATVANGVIYADDAGTLEAWSASTGSLMWSWAPPGNGSITGNIVATNSHVFVENSTNIFAVDLNTHLTAWTGTGSGSLALSEGVLYAVNGGQLLAFTATPEPSAIALLGLFTLCLIPFARHRPRPWRR